MCKLRAQARTERLGATRLRYGRLRNYKTGKAESGADHGWHDLTNALLSPPSQTEPNAGDQLPHGDAQFVESLTCRRTPLSEKQRVWLCHIAARLRRAA
jgi:hypothetical protein